MNAELISILKDLGSGSGFLAVMAVLYFGWKSGLIRLGKNGKNGKNGKTGFLSSAVKEYVRENSPWRIAEGGVMEKIKNNTADIKEVRDDMKKISSDTSTLLERTNMILELMKKK